MQQGEVIRSFSRLKQYCEDENFAGWDPYDGLNSRIFKTLPLVGRSALARLVWIQLFKRNPFNMRRLMLVPKGHNAKAIGLFLHGYCNLHNMGGEFAAGSVERINSLGDMLLQMRAPGFSGAAWGYNFPWQCRREFLFPAGEPTVVATQFCASALLEAYDITGREDFRDAALSSAQFVLRDLHRTPVGPGFLLSYSRMKGNDTIYNASLLGSRLLMLCREYGAPEPDELLSVARSSVAAVCSQQQPDGSWTYGLKPATAWKDSFHTGYNLDALQTYKELSGDNSFDEVINKGLRYYTEAFFLPDGTPKYY
ncbi:MAG: delta-aminolevulinic acid dehydratase, partial [Muribaculaceae bacterium]|nr:delta-aminolevulinic acid dehydratase [Muribaculaceae bacterium]